MSDYNTKIEVLKAQMSYFEGKKIQDLTDEEIESFVEARRQWYETRNALVKVWRAIKTN